MFPAERCPDVEAIWPSVPFIAASPPLAWWAAPAKMSSSAARIVKGSGTPRWGRLSRRQRCLVNWTMQHLDAPIRLGFSSFHFTASRVDLSVHASASQTKNQGLVGSPKVVILCILVCNKAPVMRWRLHFYQHCSNASLIENNKHASAWAGRVSSCKGTAPVSWIVV